MTQVSLKRHFNVTNNVTWIRSRVERFCQSRLAKTLGFTYAFEDICIISHHQTSPTCRLATPSYTQINQLHPLTDQHHPDRPATHIDKLHHGSVEIGENPECIPTYKLVWSNEWCRWQYVPQTNSFIQYVPVCLSIIIMEPGTWNIVMRSLCWRTQGIIMGCRMWGKISTRLSKHTGIHCCLAHLQYTLMSSIRTRH